MATEERCPFCEDQLETTRSAPHHCRCGFYYFHRTATRLAFLLIDSLILCWDGDTWAFL